jgi:hypothetical protein
MVPPDIFRAIIERAGQARRTLRGSVWNFERLWHGVPGNIRAIVVIGIFYGLYEVYKWLR